MRKAAVAVMAVLILLPASFLALATPASGATPAENTWVTKEPMHKARSSLGVAVVNGKIYAIGGSTSVFLGFDSPPGQRYAVTRYATNEVYTPVGYGTVPPVIDVVSPVSKTYNESSVSLVFTVNKLANWTGYSLDGQDNVTITGNTTISGLTNGVHNVTVYAKDTYGNTGASDTVTFTVEVPFPTTVVIASAAVATAIGVSLASYFIKTRRKKQKRLINRPQHHKPQQPEWLSVSFFPLVH